MRVLLVEPAFPIAAKSRNHKDFLPIGLLKIAAYLRQQGCDIKLARGSYSDDTRAWVGRFVPDEVWVTSLFTYWAPYVREAVNMYRSRYAGVRIRVGGIYASLFSESEVRGYTGCDDVWQGVLPEAEMCEPAYDLVADAKGSPVDYQIIHASRGCPRCCEFCGTWRIEPKFTCLSTVKPIVTRRKLVFYDNNLLMNPNLETILSELTELKSQGRLLWCEAQSGFDGRVLMQMPHIAGALRAAGFRYPRIAWDWSPAQHEEIRMQLDILNQAGYPRDEIFVLMLYNWQVPFEDMERKRLKCWEWGVQIADCRYRPLDIINDNYSPNRHNQDGIDYYICAEAGWSDARVRQFRRNVRQQNICLRHGFPFYSSRLEHKRISVDDVGKMKSLEDPEEKLAFARQMRIEAWSPSNTRMPEEA